MHFVNFMYSQLCEGRGVQRKSWGGTRPEGGGEYEEEVTFLVESLTKNSGNFLERDFKGAPGTLKQFWRVPRGPLIFSEFSHFWHYGGEGGGPQVPI